MVTAYSQCERYECHQKECNFNSKTISEIKNHIREKHEEGTFIHIKMNRKNFIEVDSKGYTVSTESDED